MYKTILEGGCPIIEGLILPLSKNLQKWSNQKVFALICQKIHQLVINQCFNVCLTLKSAASKPNCGYTGVVEQNGAQFVIPYICLNWSGKSGFQI